MSTNIYQTVAAEAWSVYTSTQAKYRGPDYMKKLEPLYKTFYGELGKVDAVIGDLKKKTPPTEESLNAAAEAFTAMQTTLSSMEQVVSTFPTMDKQAINKQATLDQAAYKKIYGKAQDADATMLLGCGNALMGAQEAAGRAVGAFAPS